MSQRCLRRLFVLSSTAGSHRVTAACDHSALMTATPSRSVLRGSALRVDTPTWRKSIKAEQILSLNPELCRRRQQMTASQLTDWKSSVCRDTEQPGGQRRKVSSVLLNSLLFLNSRLLWYNDCHGSKCLSLITLTISAHLIHLSFLFTQHVIFILVLFVWKDPPPPLLCSFCYPHHAKTAWTVTREQPSDSTEMIWTELDQNHLS